MPLRGHVLGAGRARPRGQLGLFTALQAGLCGYGLKVASLRNNVAIFFYDDVRQRYVFWQRPNEVRGHIDRILADTNPAAPRLLNCREDCLFAPVKSLFRPTI